MLNPSPSDGDPAPPDRAAAADRVGLGTPLVWQPGWLLPDRPALATRHTINAEDYLRSYRGSKKETGVGPAGARRAVAGGVYHVATSKSHRPSHSDCGESRRQRFSGAARHCQ